MVWSVWLPRSRTVHVFNVRRTVSSTALGGVGCVGRGSFIGTVTLIVTETCIARSLRFLYMAGNMSWLRGCWRRGGVCQAVGAQVLYHLV